LAHRRFFRMLCLLCAAACILSVCSCKGAAPTPYGLLVAMQEAEKPLPPGRVYLRSAAVEDGTYLSDELLTALFGNGTFPPAMDGVCDAACFFSYTHPCELAVFLCKSLSATKAVSQMCLRRLDTLRQYRSYEGLSDAQVNAYLDAATVTVRGCYVILCVSSDPDAALRALRRAT